MRLRATRANTENTLLNALILSTKIHRPYCFLQKIHQGPVARSLVSANRWLRGIKMYRFPWYLTLVSTNHASSNPGQIVNGL